MKRSVLMEALFPLIAFSIDTVVGLTGLSRGQLTRWDRNGFFHPALADPNRRRPYSRIYSLDDVIALRMIAKQRGAGVSFAELGNLVPFLEPDENGEWPPRCFHVVGSRIFLSREDAIAAAKETGRLDEPKKFAMESVIAEVIRAVQRLRERTPEHIGQVTRHRGIMGGVPIIAGTRIPTETIAAFHNEGYSVAWILKEFPRLTEEDVRAAVEFENQGEAVTRELAVARR